MTAAVFVSYRRGAASGHAGRLYDSMIARLGESAVFMDVDNIRPGDDFTEVLDRTLAACRAVVVVIDREWLGARDRDGRRRLDNPHDFVRIEIETALRHRVRVIPVLVDEADMPGPADLPPAIRAMANRQAIEISSTRFRHDTDQLIDAVERALRTPTESWTELATSNVGAPFAASDSPMGVSTDLVLQYEVSSRPIRADAQTVWAVLAEIARYPHDMPTLLTIKPTTSGPVRRGFKFRGTVKFLGMSQEMSGEFSVFEPPYRLGETRVYKTGDRVNATRSVNQTLESVLVRGGSATVIRAVVYGEKGVWALDRITEKRWEHQRLANVAKAAEAEYSRRAG